MCISIVCFPCCDVVSFEINFIFLIKPFSYMTKKSRQKFKYLENEKSFQGEIKNLAVAVYFAILAPLQACLFVFFLSMFNVFIDFPQGNKN